MGNTPAGCSLQSGLKAQLWRYQIGDAVYNRVVLFAFWAVQGAGDYLFRVFHFYIELQLSLTHRAGETIHQVSFHSSNYTTKTLSAVAVKAALPF